MATTNVQTISLSEAVFILRIRLGPLRNWTNFLNDNIRGMQDVAGHRLLPCGRRHDGRIFRPIYAVADVLAFIEDVLAAVPEAGRKPIQPTTLKIDRGRFWRINKFDKSGAPVAMLL